MQNQNAGNNPQNSRNQTAIRQVEWTLPQRATSLPDTAIVYPDDHFQDYEIIKCQEVKPEIVTTKPDKTKENVSFFVWAIVQIIVFLPSIVLELQRSKLEKDKYRRQPKRTKPERQKTVINVETNINAPAGSIINVKTNVNYGG